MKDQGSLLLTGLDLNKAHVWPSYRLTDRFGIGGVILLPLYIWLHVPGRHQTHPVPKLLKLSSPMMGCRTGFHSYKARPLLCKKCQQPTPCQPALDDDRP